VMTGGLGVAANGQEKMYHYIENVFEHHMCIGDEGRAMYMYVCTYICIYSHMHALLGMYTALSAHESTLYSISAESKHTVVLHQLQNTCRTLNLMQYATVIQDHY